MNTPTTETNVTDTPLTEDTHKKYLVIAADMAFYDGHSLEVYNLVMTSAKDDMEALETATSALEEGCLPLGAFSADDLRELADLMTARPLKPKESYNLSTGMTDVEMSESDDEEA